MEIVNVALKEKEGKVVREETKVKRRKRENKGKAS